MVITIPLIIIDLNEDGYHVLINVQLFGLAHKVVLDTGASKTALDLTMLTQANAEADIVASDRLSTGLGTNTMVSSITKLVDFFVGELHIPDFEVTVLDLSAINIAYRQLNHPEVLGVLGSDVLMKYKAVIDYGKGVLKLNASEKKRYINLSRF